MNELDAVAIRSFLPHRYPFILVDRILDFESRQRIIGLKNVSMNEPFFQGHFPDNPVMPGVLILEALMQTGSMLLVQDSEFMGRYSHFCEIEKTSFSKSVVPGDQLRLEIDVKRIKDDTIRFHGQALVEGQIACEGTFTFQLSKQPSRPQIHPTAYVDRSAILGKDVVIGPNTIIGENVVIGDGTTIEANCYVEKWTRIGEDCRIYFGCVIGSAAQDVKYKGEKSWVVIGDRNEIREYVTINRPTGKDTLTQVGSDNIFLTNVHIAHNCILGDNIVIANQTTLGGHTEVESKVTIGGMTGVHQFTRIGRGAMVGAYTRLTQDMPPFMLCEGNPALIRGMNLVGMKRGGVSKDAMAEVKSIFKILYRSKLNTNQALEEMKALSLESEEATHLFQFLSADSHRGLLKKSMQGDD